MSKLVLDRRAILAAGLSSVALSACSSLIGPPVAPPLYLLKPPPLPPSGGAHVPWQMSVVLPEAPDSLDTSRIALVQAGGTMDYYADAVWQDRLSLLVQSALIEAFESGGRIGAVGRDTEGFKSDYLLETDIRDFQAHYDAPDAVPTAVVRIAAKMVDAHTRTITLALVADSTVPAGANSVPAAVAALNAALANVLREIVDWASGAPMPAKRV
ncbi:MAG TPA: ABC-type transport auxiliary lipoprotein family protein [Rhizomicrobium sp.]